MQGIQGPTGTQGSIGPTGNNGIQGPTGVAGTAGAQGIQGPTGVAGTAGAQGSTGPQGIQGIQGPTGAPSAAASYVRGSRSSAQSGITSAPTTVTFNQTDISYGSDISLDTSTGIITLAANKTYRCIASVPTFVPSSNTMRPGFSWYNRTTSTQIGSLSAGYSNNDAASNGSLGGISEVIINTNIVTSLDFRVVSLGPGTIQLGGNGDFATIGSYPWFDIQVIANFSPALNGATGATGPRGMQGITGAPGYAATLVPSQNGYIPYLSSNSQFGFTTSASSEYSASYAAYKCVANPPADWAALGNSTANLYWQIQLPNPQIVYQFQMSRRASNEYFVNFTFDGSNDGVTWTTLKVVNGDLNNFAYPAIMTQTIYDPTYTPYIYYRCKASTVSGTNPGIGYFQLYTYMQSSFYTGPLVGTGATGPRGATGPQGIQGPTGPAATLYLLEAYSNAVYTLPGSYTADTCRYSIVNNTVNVNSAWFNTSTYTFTPQKAGYWKITATYDVYRNGEAALGITKNGTNIAIVGAISAVTLQVTKLVYLNGSTDYITIFNNGANANARTQTVDRSWFQALFVG